MDKIAVYCVQMKWIDVWDSKNTRVFKNCKSVEQAKEIIRATGIEQELSIQ